MKKINLLICVIFIVIIKAFSQNYPFPHTYTYTNGTIKPNNYTQAQMNQHVKDLWDQWKVVYLKNDCPNQPNQYYVKFSDGSHINTSEGMGYGMMLSAYMAGYDANAKTYFDGLYNFYKAHPSTISGSQYLMAWEQKTGCSNAGGADAATDGDLDIAYSLLLADKQWGSTGTINYKQAAVNMINQIMSQEVNGTIIKLGDWYDNTDATFGNSTRSSDFICDHFRAFQFATNNSKWANVVDKVYSIVSTIQTNNSPSTGLLPDFIVKCNTTPIPASANFYESANDGYYYYNACRVPWRIGTDYLISGDARAKTACNKISSWINTKVSGNANNIRTGYTLTGANITGNNFDDPTFIGPFGVGAMCSTNQIFVNSCYNYLLSNQYTPMSDAVNYFQNSIQLLCVLVMSGNYWPPSATSGFTLSTTATHGTVLISPDKAIYTSGDLVTLTAQAENGYLFDSWSGDATGNTNPLQVTMTTNKNITANFKSISGQWCAVQNDIFNTGSWIGGKDDIGSVMDTAFKISGGEIKAPYTIAKMSKPDAWDTYIELDGILADTSKRLTGLSKVKITYKSDRLLLLSLPQEPLDLTGESFQISLAASATWITVEAPLSQFVKPDWSTDVTPLNLNIINSISITPDVNPTSSAISGTIEVKELLLCDVPTIVNVLNQDKKTDEWMIFPNPASQTIFVKYVGNINANSTVEILNVSNQVVYKKQDCSQSVEQIDLSALSKGVYFIKITGNDQVKIKKLIIN